MPQLLESPAPRRPAGDKSAPEPIPLRTLPPPVRDKLRFARGLLIGLAISLAIWAFVVVLALRAG